MKNLTILLVTAILGLASATVFAATTPVTAYFTNHTNGTVEVKYQVCPIDPQSSTPVCDGILTQIQVVEPNQPISEQVPEKYSLQLLEANKTTGTTTASRVWKDVCQTVFDGESQQVIHLDEEVGTGLLTCQVL